MSFARVKALKKFVEEMFEKEDKNPNRPRRGDIIRVEPIRKKEHLEAIKELLKDEPRNLALFVFGINTALRASDICVL